MRHTFQWMDYFFCSNLFNTRDIPKRENPSCFQLCMYIMHATLNRFAKPIAVLQSTFLGHFERENSNISINFVAKIQICQVILALKFKYCRDASQIARVFFGKAYFQSCLFFFCRYFHDGLQTVEHFGTYIEDLVSKLSVIRQSQFEEKRDLEEVRNMLKTSPGFNKTVNIFIQQKIHIFTIFFKMHNRVTRSSLKKHL